MRRTSRHKILQISVFFLIYSIIHVLSASDKNDLPEASEKVRERNPQLNIPSIKGTTTTSSTTTSTTSTSSSTTSTTSTAKPNITGDATSKTTSTSEKPEENDETTTMSTSNATMPTVSNDTEPSQKCTTPAIEQFPRPLMDNSTRRHGGLIIHLLVAIYTFFGLAIVCDEYFVASLDRICEELKMAPDVAGATFMAAGSSAPELATVVIGVFLAKDDIGISGVIGSAVFNIMFVISVCALCTTTVAYLNWWPLVRDCFFYAVSILVLLITIYDKRITRGESILMLIMYVIYCIVLHFNTPLEKWAQTWPVPCKKYVPQGQTEQSDLVTYKNLEENGKHQTYGGITPEPATAPAPVAEIDFNKMWEDPSSYENQFNAQAFNQPQPVESAPPVEVPVPCEVAMPQSQAPVQHDYYKPKEYDPSKVVDPLVKPEDPNIFIQAKWYLIYPIHYLCRKTMPDCRSDKYKNWYPFTFFVSMLWISFYSYFMVWMITIIGFTMNIPDTVMGLTFVAAGVSVPDALSSIAVIREGYGDMAVSNAVGSNVFDILVCLGLPWFLKTAVVSPGSQVKVISKGLTYSTLSLLSTVVFLLVTTHLNGWKLDKKYGVILMVWYIIFITFASLYELNVFGYMNPRECSSDY
ncbi:probable sodium/potassium/calcium exchanger CG1090 [Harmonia axyridis]|uniref:probable sodium/potassium/calcium exchanger CG1090 n=1 Tax=Harmonia axyridis TaxID=115357 RepID=UPI001E277340|nr:probable sodium/potassium/calcium exchanger CG1090 [Harmonia axyridis]XP_045473132.1 probable sodium/potassium/calcium exchanger CG1090 [Harmonia axyridis]XP_045473134.1 probable sodium/potassium/calcium exchanger CG1090 [Harmonia axyridis]XP_045473135.1 probable sodium/potassium/calcium exchanger CG1090 [Harmonia axyridis]XP_045473136.1 probable sodium/potassium/calcium exchanger CG1090 [Harmonia axyridis]